jgi:hypothetical protein
MIVKLDWPHPDAYPVFFISSDFVKPRNKGVDRFESGDAACLVYSMECLGIAFLPSKADGDSRCEAIQTDAGLHIAYCL